MPLAAEHPADDMSHVTGADHPDRPRIHLLFPLLGGPAPLEARAPKEIFDEWRQYTNSNAGPNPGNGILMPTVTVIHA